MLKKEEQNNPEAVELYFCKPLSEYKPTPLSEDQSKIMIVICMLTEGEIEEFEQDFIKCYFFYPAIQKRLEGMFTYKMDTKAKLLLCSWCNSFGDIAMYLTLLQYLCKKRNVRELNLDTLTLMFPSGIPSVDYMRKIWDGQKVERGDFYSDNIIDCLTAMKSIQFSEQC